MRYHIALHWTNILQKFMPLNFGKDALLIEPASKA